MKLWIAREPLFLPVKGPFNTAGRTLVVFD